MVSGAFKTRGFGALGFGGLGPLKQVCGFEGLGF